jgi:hypothetical protein
MTAAVNAASVSADAPLAARWDVLSRPQQALVLGAADRAAAERARAGLPETIQDTAIIRAVARVVWGASRSAASRTPESIPQVGIHPTDGASHPAAVRVHPSRSRVAKASTSELGPVVGLRGRSHSPRATTEARDVQA